MSWGVGVGQRVFAYSGERSTLGARRMTDLTLASRTTATVSANPVCCTPNQYSNTTQDAKIHTRCGHTSPTAPLSIRSTYAPRWSSSAMRVPRSGLANSVTIGPSTTLLYSSGLTATPRERNRGRTVAADAPPWDSAAASAGRIRCVVKAGGKAGAEDWMVLRERKRGREVRVYTLGG